MSVGAPLPGAVGGRRVGVLALDLFPIAAAFGLTLAGLGRPILAGLAVLAPAIGLIVTDRVKRIVLDEPVMFADRAELLEVVRHPHLYIAFVGWVPMIGGALACMAAVGGLIRFEPPLWHVPGWAAWASPVAAVLAARALFVMPTMPAILARLAAAYDRLSPSRDPDEDARRFGMLASFIIHATLARAERQARQAAVHSPALPACPAKAGPIVIVQGESFVDAAGLHPAFADLLPHFARLRREAVAQGGFVVPCWGANTIRTEFEVLTGVDTQRLGLDRFNPYEAFALAPLPSLAAQARAAGYRTVCLHPYDRRFYGRDRVMPQLGFDTFIGIEGFADAARNGLYVRDVAVAARIAALMREHGPRLFVVAMTMENHGPWDKADDPATPVPLPPELASHAQAAPFGRWLDRLRGTDAMIPILREALEEAGGGWLALYGDHQPSFAGFLEALGTAHRDTDYAIWRPGGGNEECRPLAAHELAPTLLRLMAEEQASARRRPGHP